MTLDHGVLKTKNKNTDAQFNHQPLKVAQMVKNLPAKQETQGWSLGWEDPLKKRMAT